MSQVFRVERTKNFTVMSNHHLKDKALTLKAKGLLSIMLSLPDEWDYNLKGLATLSRDGLDSVRSSRTVHWTLLPEGAANSTGAIGCAGRENLWRLFDYLPAKTKDKR